MRIIVSLLLIINLAYTCDGDCMKCHPKLLKNGKLDKDHKILKNCINCHKITTNDLNKMGSLCGQDCWDCHSIQKTMLIKNKEHLALNGCIKCHIKLHKENIFKNDCNDFSNLKNLFNAQPLQ